jgi:hypothetical protein
MVFLSLVHEMTALGGRRVRDATRVDHNELRLLRDVNLRQAERLEKLANLLAFVLVDLATGC